ncbi:MAG: hypothetical protein R3B06_11625 [Kofleriaceae bacterium]
MIATTGSLRRRALGLSLGVLALGAGCGGVKDASQITLALGPAQLDIVEATGTRHGVVLAADGQVTVDGTALVTVTTKGRLTSDGGPALVLTKDGSVLSGGQRTNLQITPAPAFILDGTAQLTMDDAGAITGPLLEDLDHPMFNADGATLTYKGPTAARRTMMFVLAGALTRGDVKPAPVPPLPAR